MSDPLRIIISIDRQDLRVVQGRTMLRVYRVSTAARGTGFEPNSYRTPTGRFRIAAKIGAGAPLGTIFRSREPVGIWQPTRHVDHDLILTRILRLDGLDDCNRNTYDRFIYLHGTNQEALLGQPASAGCVRLSNHDVIELFDLVPIGAEVIIEPSAKSFRPRKSQIHNAKHQIAGTCTSTRKSSGKVKIFLASNRNGALTHPVMSAKKKGIRYTTQKKAEVVAFVNDYNTKHGRGGQSKAATKYGITQLTIAAWLKKSGKAPKKGAKPAAKAPGKQAAPAGLKKIVSDLQAAVAAAAKALAKI
jgi:hypothetical protein